MTTKLEKPGTSHSPPSSPPFIATLEMCSGVSDRFTGSFSMSTPTSRQNSVEEPAVGVMTNPDGEVTSEPRDGGGGGYHHATLHPDDPEYGALNVRKSYSTGNLVSGGQRCNLIHEGDVQVCRVCQINHSIFNKILSSKYLRRWETHHLYLTDSQIVSKTVSGFMEDPISYSSIENIISDGRWDVDQSNQKYVIRIYTSDCSLHLQTSTPYLRDRWLHSIQWKRHIHKYRKTLLNTRRPEVLIKELKSMVDFSLKTPLQDRDIKQSPLEVASEMIIKTGDWLPKETREEVIHILTPLLEMSHPSPEICEFFSKHCRDSPRSCLIMDLFTPVIRRILKHNLDFCKYPEIRLFVHDFINALNAQNDRNQVMKNFVISAHGPASTCPHPRILPNLLSVGLAAVHSLFEEKQLNSEEFNNTPSALWEWEQRLECIITMFEKMASYEDWRPALAQLLQPIPFPDSAVSCSVFTKKMKPLIRKLGTDSQCDVHLMILGVREEKEGWLHLYCLGGIACDDDGQLFSEMLKKLMECCCKTKRFLLSMSKLLLGPCMLLALRDNEIAQKVLCAMLELNVIENEDYKLQIITTLQSTVSSKNHYAALCDRQNHVRQLQQKGGPRKLTLPTRSTDSDLAKLLSSGSFGNLECLSLAFTNVTSACAEHLIKLPSLRYLNFWSTQFGDSGLQMICDHLPKLQVLNLCEAPVSDKSLASLISLQNLRKLNLNSTSLTAGTFESLKNKLPSLQQCDIRYTEAWEVSDTLPYCKNNNNHQ